MPNANEEVLCAWLAAGDRGDVDEFDRYLHPEVVVHAPLGLSTTGVEAEKAVWADGKRAMPDIRHEVRETMASDSRAMARVVVTGTMIGEFAGIPLAAFVVSRPCRHSRHRRRRHCEGEAR